MKKKLLTVCAITLVLACAFSACKPKDPVNTDPTSDTPSVTNTTATQPSATVPTVGGDTETQPTPAKTELKTEGDTFKITLPPGYEDISETQEDEFLRGGVFATGDRDGKLSMLLLIDTKAGSLTSAAIDAEFAKYNESLTAAAAGFSDQSTEKAYKVKDFTVTRTSYFGERAGMKMAVIGGVATNDKASFYIEFSIAGVDSVEAGNAEFDEVVGAIQVK